ncbi:response regulator [Natronosalvus halobius]|uniref:response regulator n=1 Tax=Natronosalvus halobius TaxID=2953746 RepID=UPI00209F1C9C|nr:response regulator [Natronosalvus halobius]USZ71674.1 response regulator [Natronosalvus halobius]
MTDADAPVVLIVEDEPDVAESYELWLAGRYEIRRAHDGEDALDVVDDTVDVVLLDRMMPKLSGEQVLREIRERGIDCRVAMVTAVEPDFDVVEMGFDAYITKPPERADLIGTIDQLLERATLDGALQEYHSLLARKGALESEKPLAELEASDEYRNLLDRIDAKQAEIDGGLGDMSSDIDFVSAIRELADDAEGGDQDGSDAVNRITDGEEER